MDKAKWLEGLVEGQAVALRSAYAEPGQPVRIARVTRLTKTRVTVCGREFNRTCKKSRDLGAERGKSTRSAWGRPRSIEPVTEKVEREIEAYKAQQRFEVALQDWLKGGAHLANLANAWEDPTFQEAASAAGGALIKLARIAGELKNKGADDGSD